jgi:peptidoglycan/LPS O-acetylase OafA/YrhL
VKPPLPHATTSQYRPDIDGLRALAVLAVVGYHAFPGRLAGGFIGVDVFFVISGFLISGIIASSLKNGTFTLGGFYARRIRRIFPALILVLSTTLLAGWLLLLPGEYEKLLKNACSGALFFSNFLSWTEAGYFDVSPNLKPLLHLWSLGVEEQFYIIWPMILTLAWRHGQRAFLGILTVALASFLINVSLVNSYPVATFYLPFGRFWELMIGASLTTDRVGRAISKLDLNMTVISIAGLALVVASALLFDSSMRYPGWGALMPTFGSALLIAAGPQSFANRYILSWRPAVLIGLISYPLYLWHWPLLSFGSMLSVHFSARNFVLIKLGLLSFAFFLAFATYRLLERKVRASPAPRYVMALCLFLLGTCATGIILSTIPISGSDEAFAWDEIHWRSPSCISKYKLEQDDQVFCVQSNPNKLPSVLLLGDSHSNHWMPGIEKTSPDIGVLNIASAGCPYLMNVDSFPPQEDISRRDTCSKTMSRAFEYLRGSRSVKTVILSAQSSLQIPASDEKPTWLLKSTNGIAGESNLQIFKTALGQTLTELNNEGKRTIIILDVPSLGFDPRDCVRLKGVDVLLPLRKTCAVPRAIFEHDQEPSREAIKEVASQFPAVEIWDPIDVLCDRFWCYAQKNQTTTLYRNDNHLSADGSRYIWNVLSQGGSRLNRLNNR